MVTGFKIPFTEIPQQQALPKRPSFTEQETLHIEAEITKLLKCRVLAKCEKEKGDYFSNIFLRPKRNGDYHMILNLKGLNKYIPYHHFKMKNLQRAIRMMSKNCYFSSVDLSDAYYSCPVHVSFQKYLKFQFDGMCYKYTVFPNGLACCPRLFTILLKPVFASLPKKCHKPVVFIDDT